MSHDPDAVRRTIYCVRESVRRSKFESVTVVWNNGLRVLAIVGCETEETFEDISEALGGHDRILGFGWDKDETAWVVLNGSGNGPSSTVDYVSGLLSAAGLPVVESAGRSSSERESYEAPDMSVQAWRDGHLGGGPRTPPLGEEGDWAESMPEIDGLTKRVRKTGSVEYTSVRKPIAPAGHGGYWADNMPPFAYVLVLKGERSIAPGKFELRCSGSPTVMASYGPSAMKQSLGMFDTPEEAVSKLRLHWAHIQEKYAFVEAKSAGDKAGFRDWNDPLAMYRCLYRAGFEKGSVSITQGTGGGLITLWSDSSKTAELGPEAYERAAAALAADHFLVGPVTRFGINYAYSPLRGA